MKMPWFSKKKTAGKDQPNSKI